MADGWNDWVRVGTGTLAARKKRPWHYIRGGLGQPTLCKRRFPPGTSFNIRFGSTVDLIHRERCCGICLERFCELAGIDTPTARTLAVTRERGIP